MRYKEYKKVGIPWLNEIPTHWEEKNINNLFDERIEKVSDKDFTPLSVTKNGILPQLENVAKSMATDNRKKVLEGDFVINSRSDRKGSSGISEYDGSVSLISTVIIPRQGYSKFWHYLLKSNDFVEEFYRNGRGIVADLWTTNFQNMKSIVLPIPPKEEQEQIARYLDWKINEIDRLIGGYRNKIQYINLIKSQLIANEYMKSDEKIRLKMLLKNDMEYGLNISGDISGDFRYVRITDIDNNGNLKETDQQFVSNFDKKYILNKGDIIFARSGATVGKTYYYKESDGNCAYAGYLIRARVNKDLVYSEYIYYFTQSEIYEEWKNSIFIQSTIQNINAEKYSNLLIPMFDKEVQKKVIKNCKLIINRIDKIEKNQAQQINNLKQLKQSLISDVVTGKIDVRNVSIPEYEKVKDIEDDAILEDDFNEEV